MKAYAGKTLGTCATSNIGGIQTGVAKRAKLIVVKSGTTIASLIDAVGKVVLEIQNRFPIKHPKGSTVVSIKRSFDNIPEHNSYALQLHYLITLLAGKFQVVLVTSAGCRKECFSSSRTTSFNYQHMAYTLRRY